MRCSQCGNEAAPDAGECPRCAPVIVEPPPTASASPFAALAVAPEAPAPRPPAPPTATPAPPLPASMAPAPPPPVPTPPGAPIASAAAPAFGVAVPPPTGAPPPPPPPPPPSYVVPTPNVPPPPALAPTGPFRSLDGLAVALTWLLGSSAVVAAGIALASWHRRGIVDRVQRGDGPGLDEVRGADFLVNGMSGLFGLLSLATFVILIVFLWRASSNTKLWQGGNPRFRVGWTIGAWFVPFANLVLPAMVVQDIWHRSPALDVNGHRHQEPSTFIGWWWVTWIASYLLRSVGGTPGDASDTVTELSSGDAMRAIGAVLAIAAAVLLIAIVRRLTVRQEQLACPTQPAAVMAPPAAGGYWPNRV
jgi:hypothetical protein